MPVQPFGKADPYYDALRVMSNQNIQGAALGDTGAGSGLENKIYVWHADGSTIDLFDADTAGMTAALAAWAAGDVVWLPAQTIAGNFTITQTVRGIDRRRSILSGVITLNAGAIINNLSITGGATANDECVIYNCDISAATAPVLTITGSVSHSPYIYHSTILTTDTNVSNYALVCTGYCYVQYCDILSETNGASINHQFATFAHCIFHTGAGTAVYAVNLVNGRLWECQIESASGNGLTFAGGSALVANTSMYVRNPVKLALLITAAGLILSDCNFNTHSGLSLATLLDGDRAKWNHTHSTTSPSAQPPTVIQYDNVGADYEVITDDASYNAFPGFVVAANGTYIIVYRKATNHDASKGTIVKKTSTDGGLTWSSESTVVNDATYDVRDPQLTRLANGNLMITYTRYNQAGAIIPGDQARVITSVDNGVNWGSAVTITSGFTSWSFISSDIVELSNGDLLAPMYGQDTGDTYWSSKVSKSTDGGATWANLATIANGETLTKLVAEPHIVLMNDGSLLSTFRLQGVDPTTFPVGISTSADSGATWSAAVSSFSMAGNPYLLHLADDSVICITRKATTYEIVARATTDGGTTWSDENILDTSTYDAMQYAQAVEIYPGLMAVAYAVGSFTTNSDIRFLWMAEGGNPNATDALVGSSLTIYGGDINIIGGGQIVSTTPTGTAPLVITSTTKVDNLNADMVDGLHASQLGHTIQDEGVALTARTNLNFVGDIVTATDDVGNNATVVTINSNAPLNIYNETQSADGISTIYYLTNYATPSTIRVYIDGIRQPASDDIAPTDIVSFSVAPDLGATLLFDYEMDLT